LFSVRGELTAPQFKANQYVAILGVEILIGAKGLNARIRKGLSFGMTAS